MTQFKQGHIYSGIAVCAHSTSSPLQKSAKSELNAQFLAIILNWRQRLLTPFPFNQRKNGNSVYSSPTTRLKKQPVYCVKFACPEWWLTTRRSSKFTKDFNFDKNFNYEARRMYIRSEWLLSKMSHISFDLFLQNGPIIVFSCLFFTIYLRSTP